LDIFSLIESGQVQATQEAMNQLVTDFKNNELLPHTMFLCGDRYFTKACQERDKGLQAEAVEDFKSALDVWQKLVQLPDSTTTVEGYYHLAVCYEALGEYEHAIEYYTKVADGYPNYRLVWDAQFMIGHTYEKMLKAGLISESVAKPLISAAYKKVLEKYPGCEAAGAARSWLNRN
jgi:TolA-binding protein